MRPVEGLKVSQSVYTGLMIGTQDMATVASTLLYMRKGLPEGWEFLGEGCYRAAFLAPDGVVYKVQHYTEGADSTENEDEYANFKRASKRIVLDSMGTCRLAPCYLWDDNVLAMEYVPVAEYAMEESDDPYSPDAFTIRAQRLWGYFTRHNIFDAAAKNLWFDAKGILTMVDYAA